MREYRGKTTTKENKEHAFNNVWVWGDLVVSRDKYYIHPRTNAFQVNNALSKLIVLHEVIPETVGQYTGLTDKNGKKIFEGDIVRCYGGESCQGFWEYDEIVVVNIADYIAILTISELEYIEVIGNKWDNPELLKGE